MGIGSSPRGRGTREEPPLFPVRLRFIPARAGNTGPSSSTWSAGPVHPRAGGEHFRQRRSRLSWSGSSPRGRGTHAGKPPAQEVARFIPARAGNTKRSRSPRGSAPVHPRAGGEHGRRRPCTPATAGSSPRGRGTRALRRRPGWTRRFIPARAGNTSITTACARLATVHPRAGGEHWSERLRSAARFGSSPRGRGTPLHDLERGLRRRFIPARAGNTGAGRGRVGRVAVHPRAGGEHSMEKSMRGGSNGSSPRGRGTRLARIHARKFFRFIPARAGNTIPGKPPPDRGAVHPRAGGEHFERRGSPCSPAGSSPRGRGTHVRALRQGLGRRFIPARAGNTWSGRGWSCW